MAEAKVRRLDLKMLVEVLPRPDPIEPGRIVTYLFSLEPDPDSRINVSTAAEFDEVAPLGIMRQFMPTQRFDLSITATKVRMVSTYPTFCPIAYVLDDPVEVVRCFIEASGHSSHEGTASNGSPVTW